MEPQQKTDKALCQNLTETQTDQLSPGAFSDENSWEQEHDSSANRSVIIGLPVIRLMAKRDLDQVMQIEEQSFSNPWSRDSMEKEMVNPDAHYLAAELDGRIVGYVGYWLVLDEGHIMNVAVAEDCRGQHIGTALVNAMLESGKPLGIHYWTLEVRVSNAPAIHVYEKAGFVCAGVRPRYYSDPEEDAGIYWLMVEEK